MIHLQVGENVQIDPDVTLGYRYAENAGPTTIGRDSRIRSGSIIYCDVSIGPELTTGHDTLVREHTIIGQNVMLGTKSVIDGRVTIGSDVSIQTGVYIPPETSIGDRVFLGPNVVFTNDPYPLRHDVDLLGPTIGDDVSIGANATLLPGVDIGTGSFVAAGAVVTEDVPPHRLAIGVPATTHPLPDELTGQNVIT